MILYCAALLEQRISPYGVTLARPYTIYPPSMLLGKKFGSLNRPFISLSFIRYFLKYLPAGHLDLLLHRRISNLCS